MIDYNGDDCSTSHGVKDPSLRRFLGRACATGALIGLSLFPAGCEEDNSSNFNFGTNDPNLVLALGDSITAGGSIASTRYPYQLAELIGKNVRNEGRCGHTSVDGARRVAAGLLTRYSPGHLLVMFGANDIHYSVPHATSMASFRSIIQAARANNTRVIVGTAIPRFAQNNEIITFNQGLTSLIAEEGVTLADTYNAIGTWNRTEYRDGTHLNGVGNATIARCYADVF